MMTVSLATGKPDGSDFAFVPQDIWACAHHQGI